MMGEERATIQIDRAGIEDFFNKELEARAANKTTKLDAEIEPVSNFKYRSANLLVLPQQTTQHNVCWIVELQSLGGSKTKLPIALVGEVSLGIKRPGKAAPDLDLSVYGAEEKGVSRQHALLRPTGNHLYLVDLGSKNGTRINNLPVEPNTPVELQGNDTISLGIFTFIIRVFETPQTMERSSLRAAPR